MLSKEILSLQHPFVKECVSLRLDGAIRAQSKSLLLMGKKMVQELSQKVPLKTLITCLPEKGIRAQESVIVSPEVLKKITGLPQPDGFAAIAPLPEPCERKNAPRTLILDQVADPGNMGTLLRTALGLNWDAVIFTPGTVDPFNDKALRASKGALFFLSFCMKTPEEIASWLKTQSVSLYLADLDGTPIESIKPTSPLALLLSHEGAGLSSWTKSLGKKVRIPMFNQVESLNVAVSGAILLHHLGHP
ncbi:MAG TPA: RNA methyltransferase [Chlamydiales bacterium]|jgi:TrmH family RNA methyltransferase